MESPAPPRHKHAKSDLDRHGAGLVLSRDHGDQLLMQCADGTIAVITALMGKDGHMKIGIRCNRDCNVQRREVTPQEWIDCVEADAQNR